jgi:hypothetical protein
MAYAYIARSLFKSDRLMFAMHLAHGMFPKKIPDNVKTIFFFMKNQLKSIGVEISTGVGTG